ncbi:MFS transporter [Plantibacter sp. Mn2098]|uniref:MFS transporter n=1 Tax=Plantibacter sp. Mn2098 TaxID=3395266 RepID=UPI003BEE0E19
MPEVSTPTESAEDSATATPFPRLIVAMATSVIGFYIAVLTPVQLLLTLHLSVIAGPGAAAAFSVVTGVGALTAMVMNPLAGRLSDRTAARFGRRRTWILTGALAGGLALFAMSGTSAVWQVAVVWCVIQTVTNFQWAATSALLPDQVPSRRRGTASGILGLCTAAGPLIGLGTVSAVQQPALQWAAIAIASAVCGVISVLLLRDAQWVGPEKVSVSELVRSYWVNPRRHPAFAWAWAVRFLITCAYASNTYTAFLLLERFGLPQAEVSANVLLLSALTVGVLAVTSVISGILSDRLRRQKPFVIASGVLAAGALVILAAAQTMPAVFLATSILGVALGLFFAVDSALCVRMLPRAEDAGKDLAVINLANTLPQAFVPFIAPALLALGSYPALYVFLAVLGLLGAAAVLRLPEIGREGDPRFAQITRKPSTRPERNPA